MPTERRPGAVRSERSRLAILAAAARQFAERGYDHLTIEGIAAEAGVGKQTIYRWWGSKSALVAECLVEGMLIPVLRPRVTGDSRADLTSWVEGILDFLPGNESLLRSLVVAAAEDPEVAARLNERLGILPLDPADEPPFPLETVEALIGAIVIRSLRRGGFEEGYATRLVDAVLGGV